ncbi:radical SAM protein [archaeon]|nr:radical SAM protein [archaeon]
MKVTLEKKLNSPPLPKCFFTYQEADAARKNNQILMAAIFLYPECSNECLFCCYSEKRKIKEEMNLDEYKLLLKEVAALGVKTVFVPGMGEPFLRKRGNVFLEFAQAANENNLYVVVPSNLNPEPTPEFIMGLHQLNVSVIGKMESMIPEVLNQITNPKIPYHFVKVDEGHIPQGLSLLMEAGFNKENRLGCGTCVNTLNVKEVENIFIVCNINFSKF